jgi:hypothetical protein
LQILNQAETSWVVLVWSTRRVAGGSDGILEGSFPTLHPKREENPDAKRPSVNNKEMDALVKAAGKAGWWCVKSRKNYVKCYPPDESKMVSVPNTPSGSRTPANYRLLFRRKGLNV